MQMRVVAIPAIVMLSLVGGTLAARAYDKLGPKAVAVPAADLQAAYAGKTIIWPDHSGSVYWAADGTAVGYSQKSQAIGDGTWTASDGMVCYDIVWMGIKPGDKPYPLKNCFHYRRDGKTYYNQFTSDKMKSHTGWWKGKGDLALLKPGNLIQKQYDQLKAKMPKN